MNVGILGGGQLGRMIALAGYPLDIRCTALDPASDAPAGQVAPLIVGDYNNPASLDRLLAACDVITYEFENVPVATTTHRLEAHRPVYPPPAALAVAQDRLSEKTLFRDLGIPTPDFIAVDSLADLRAAVASIGVPAVLKTRRLGYDGKGQFVIRDPSQIEPAFTAIGGTPLILESFVPFDRELSIIAVRGRDGQMCTYPLVENHHAGGILRASYAPAPGITPQQQHTAATLAEHILTRLAYVGVLAIELFDVRGVLVANEMAPRVHNSGHWTIEGAATSQFENHLRAICGLPLGDCSPRGYSAMLNLIGDAPPLREMLAISGARVHLYGKEPRPGRKIGHVTVTHDDPAIVRNAVSQLQMLIAANDPPSTPS